MPDFYVKLSTWELEDLLRALRININTTDETWDESNLNRFRRHLGLGPQIEEAAPKEDSAARPEDVTEQDDTQSS